MKKEIDTIMKNDIIERLESNIADMDAHSYNEYKDEDERTVCLTVGEIKWLYEYFLSIPDEV